MTDIYESLHAQTRRARRDFMIAVIQVGQKALEEIREYSPELYTQILERFKSQPYRAAYWLACDRLTPTAPTPLQQIIKGEVGAVQQRLENYVLMKGR